MAIEPTNPIVEPEKIFDKIWLSFMSVESSVISRPEDIPNPDAKALICLTPYSSSDLSFSKNGLITVEISEIFQKINNGDVKLAQILSLILEYVEEEAKRQGKI
jgi:hypothetical protein